MNGNASPFSNCHALQIWDIQSNGGVANADRGYLSPPYLGHMKHLIYKTMLPTQSAERGMFLPRVCNYPLVSPFRSVLSNNSINLYKFCLIVGIFFLWWITYCGGEKHGLTLIWFWKTTYKPHIQPKIVFNRRSSWWSQSSFSLTSYVHLSNLVGNHRHC